MQVFTYILSYYLIIYAYRRKQKKTVFIAVLAILLVLAHQMPIYLCPIASVVEDSLIFLLGPLCIFALAEDTL